MTTARDKRQRVPRSRPQAPGNSMNAETIRDYVSRDANKSQMNDLEQALRCYYGLPYDLPASVFDDGSRNKIALRLGTIADQYPEKAAKIIVKEIEAELNSTAQRKRRRYWGDDELMSSVYESWTGFGRWLALRGVNRSDAAICKRAAAVIRKDTERLAAMYQLLHVEGEVLNLNGHAAYRGPVVRAACLRGDKDRVERPSTTPMAHALHGRGHYLRGLDPLEQAIVELAKMHGFWELARLVVPKDALQGVRTMFPYLIHSDPGEVAQSAILGIKEGGSTGEMRYVATNGAQVDFVYPHKAHRNVGRSNAVLERSPSPEIWFGVRIFGNALPAEGVWRPMNGGRRNEVLLSPDRDPDWSPA